MEIDASHKKPLEMGKDDQKMSKVDVNEKQDCVEEKNDESAQNDGGENEWYFLVGKEKKGPTSWAKICKLANPQSQLIWKAGMANWMTLSAAKLISQNDAWYYLDLAGQQQGPIAKWDLVNLAVTNQISPETLIWKHGSTDGWKAANAIEEIRGACGFSEPQKLPHQIDPEAPKAATSGEPDLELDWYYEDQYREKKGPVNKPELIMMLEREQIAEQTLVWKPGMEDWITVHEALFGRRVEQTVAEKKDKVVQKEKVEDIRHRLVKEVALTDECDPNSKVLGTVAKGTVVQLMETKNEQVKIKAPKLEGWCRAEDDDGPLIERVKNKDLPKKRKRKKKRKWKDVQAPAVYVSGLPQDISAKEIAEYFKKCGNIKRDILTGHLKVKIYEDRETKMPKGDALVHYFQMESVSLALKLLDGSEIRPGVTISVSPAEFKQKGEYKAKRKQKLTNAQRSVMREVYKAYSSVSWEEDPDKVAPQLRIVILKGMFTLDEVQEAPSPEYFYETLKMEVGMECERVGGPVEKVTTFERNPDGVIAVRFAKPSGSASCIDVMNNRWFAGRRVECIYWDGETDYRVQETEEEQDARLEAFGRELDAQKVPD